MPWKTKIGQGIIIRQGVNIGEKKIDNFSCIVSTNSLIKKVKVDLALTGMVD